MQWCYIRDTPYILPSPPKKSALYANETVLTAAEIAEMNLITGNDNTISRFLNCVLFSGNYYQYYDSSLKDG